MTSLIDELFDPSIARHEKRVAEKRKTARKREEEMLQRHLTNWLNLNWTQYELPRWAVRNELPTPPTGEDPEVWAMRHGKRSKDMGLLAGCYDYHLFHRGRYIIFELKANGRNLTKNQVTFGNNIEAHGGHKFTIYSVEQAATILENFGIKAKYPPAASDTASKRLITQQAVAYELNRKD